MVDPRNMITSTKRILLISKQKVYNLAEMEFFNPAKNSLKKNFSLSSNPFLNFQKYRNAIMGIARQSKSAHQAMTIEIIAPVSSYSDLRISLEDDRRSVCCTSRSSLMYTKYIMKSRTFLLNHDNALHIFDCLPSGCLMQSGIIHKVT